MENDECFLAAISLILRRLQSRPYFFAAMIESKHREGAPVGVLHGTEKVFIDRKLFYLDLWENQRGRSLKIVEDAGGRRSSIILPASGFPEFAAAFARLAEVEQRLSALK
jgi:hypothetical protein